ncbi:subtilisin-like protein [Neocallimastix lanati (nom. inval.)]|nr:subtilisin-like protein [Neocallimastix sp. JGI-2020a]
MKSFLLLIIVIIFNYFIGVYSENSYYIVSILRNESDKNYDIESEKTQQLIDNLLNDRMNDIYHIIEDNKDTFLLKNGKQDEKLKELDTVESLRKRNENGIEKKLLFKNNRKASGNHLKRDSLEFTDSTNSTIEYVPIESKLVNYGCPISNYYAIVAYLSDEAAEKVCRLENVLYCEKSDNGENKNSIKDNDVIDNENKENTQLYYDLDAIQKETNWTSVNVQSNPDDKTYFLSLISQSNEINGHKIDTNFYYPGTAGQGIDMYFIDSGIIVHPDHYDTYKNTDYERTVTCDAISDDYDVRETTEDEKTFCVVENSEYPGHGIGVSSVAGGTLGVAKKANIHMIVTDYNLISILRSIDYILQKAKPFKTVLNISFGDRGVYLKSFDDKLTDLINAGIIVIVAAGNDGINVCGEKDSEDFGTFPGCRKAIAVGAIDSYLNFEFIEENQKYQMTQYSNYGDCIDIFAPGDVVIPYLENNINDYDYTRGTSFAAPIVAGVAASIMSEHPEIQFDNDLMKKTLIDMSIKDAIIKSETGNSDIDPFDEVNQTPNRFLNNGKRSVYIPKEIFKSCGGSRGTSCDEGCCSKDGECISLKQGFQDQCLIENGCQSEFGRCFSIDDIVQECEKELKENQECQLEISLNMNSDSDLFNAKKLKQCMVFNSEKCQTFNDHLNIGSSACSLAKTVKSFGDYVDHFDKKKYYQNTEMCNDALNYHSNECNHAISNDYDCLINNYYKEFDDESLKEICLEFKSEKCLNVQNRINETINTNPSCSLLQQIEFSNEYNGINDAYFTMTHYDEISDFCVDILSSSVDECDKELEGYEECLNYSFNMNDKNNYNEFIKTCSIDNIKCQTLFQKNHSEVLPVCYSTKHYKQNNLYDKLEKIKKEYQENCKENISEEFQVKVIEDCQKEIPDESLFYIDASSEEKFNEICRAIQSKEYEKYESVIKYIPICNLASSMFNGNNDGSSENELEITDFQINYFYQNDLKVCNDGYDLFLEEGCSNSINPKYNECIFKRLPDDDDDFYYQCNLFLEDKCQEFYHEPLSEECSILQEKDLLLILTPSHYKWQEYNDKCFDLVESKRVTKPGKSTTIKSVEATSTKSKSIKSPTTTKAKSVNKTTTTTKTDSVKKTTTKSKLVKTTTTTKSKSVKPTTTKSKSIKKTTTKSKMVKTTTIKKSKSVKPTTTKSKMVKTTTTKKSKSVKPTTTKSKSVKKTTTKSKMVKTTTIKKSKSIKSTTTKSKSVKLTTSKSKVKKTTSKSKSVKTTTKKVK